ncbi:hypothetical protein GCM10008024_27160 [Allgaiera indica]|uniref:Uncharacterized protein n=1 Tax=Allgaiera indica TaxID=765699 RepID=A0AAN4USN1_9RHOB|nr:hypothetical protein GCM10008024_27160 [Allgaiera indica]
MPPGTFPPIWTKRARRSRGTARLRGVSQGIRGDVRKREGLRQPGALPPDPRRVWGTMKGAGGKTAGVLDAATQAGVGIDAFTKPPGKDASDETLGTPICCYRPLGMEHTFFRPVRVAAGRGVCRPQIAAP